MPSTVIAATIIHVLVSVFWAGTTFTLARLARLARLAGLGGEKFVFPQLGAAAIAVLTGGYLGYALHASSFGVAEQVLAIGIACAVIAAVLQGTIGVGTLRLLQSNGLDIELARDRIGKAQRVAAALLAVTVIAMVLARYV
jgi:uncharacterized membrane protein